VEVNTLTPICLHGKERAKFRISNRIIFEQFNFLLRQKCVEVVTQFGPAGSEVVRFNQN